MNGICYNTVTWQGSKSGGFLFKSLHAFTQPNIVVSKAPIISGIPRATLPGSAGTRSDGGFAMDATKRCYRCGMLKARDQFYGNCRSKDGLTSECKDCSRNRNHHSREKIIERKRIRSIDPNCGVPLFKRCSTCGETKPRDAFFRNVANKDGLEGRCKVCRGDCDPHRRERENQRKALRAINPDYGIPDSKYCPSCGKTKSSDEFHRVNSRKDGLRDICRECISNFWEGDKKRRAQKLSAFVESFTRREIYERDGGRCHICGKKVDPNNWHLDHLIPLSLGGEHSKRNVAVAHPYCNLRRNNRGPAQLRILP
jgi:hypothetical protein